MALEVVESTRRAGEKNLWQESEVLPGCYLRGCGFGSVSFLWLFVCD